MPSKAFLAQQKNRAFIAKQRMKYRTKKRDLTLLGLKKMGKGAKKLGKGVWNTQRKIVR